MATTELDFDAREVASGGPSQAAAFTPEDNQIVVAQRANSASAEQSLPAVSIGDFSAAPHDNQIASGGQTAPAEPRLPIEVMPTQEADKYKDVRDNFLRLLGEPEKRRDDAWFDDLFNRRKLEDDIRNAGSASRRLYAGDIEGVRDLLQGANSRGNLDRFERELAQRTGLAVRYDAKTGNVNVFSVERTNTDSTIFTGITFKPDGKQAAWTLEMSQGSGRPGFFVDKVADNLEKLGLNRRRN